jgi:hypothetical protein
MSHHSHSDAGGALKSTPNGGRPLSRAPRRATATTVIVCVMGVMLYFSQQEAGALVLGTAEAAAFSTSSAPTLEISVSGSLAPAAGTSVIPVRGSLGPRGAEAERFSTQADESVQEISVTGSTVSTQNELGYRESPESWVKYVHYLKLRVDAITSATPLRAALEARLAQEKIEFGKAYPGTNIDALLSAQP